MRNVSERMVGEFPHVVGDCVREGVWGTLRTVEKKGRKESRKGPGRLPEFVATVVARETLKCSEFVRNVIKNSDCSSFFCSSSHTKRDITKRDTRVSCACVLVLPLGGRGRNDWTAVSPHQQPAPPPPPP
ncbi:hypothetical protein M0802_001606 [Mischocyttarus mexicanus]|nr:hypothetical protein M0802_001606 [Mischocyttarus mexicanus]